MSDDLAEAALAVLGEGETRIDTPELLERLRLVRPDLRAEALGKALAGAGWRAMQWRTGGGRRVRGYVPPALPLACRPSADVAANAPEPVTATLPREIQPPAGLPAAACISPGPHAGSSPPALPCRCGAHRWWRSRFRSPGWKCFCTGRPMPSDAILVVEVSR